MLFWKSFIGKSGKKFCVSFFTEHNKKCILAFQNININGYYFAFPRFVIPNQRKINSLFKDRHHIACK